jgi:ankyrin repeat protein
LLRLAPCAQSVAFLQGRTALHIAATFDNTDVVTELLKAGAKVEARAKVGSSRIQAHALSLMLPYLQNSYTPMHIAAANGNLKTVDILLQFGANVDSLTNVCPLHESSCLLLTQVWW